jgi:hypothetical protein
MYLADCHNPENGCFPTQVKIAEFCEISRRSVNNHLDKLEKCGLIVRHDSVDEETHRQRPTRYYLAFEEGFAAKQKAAGIVVDKAASRVQTLHTEPCAKSAEKPCANFAHKPCNKKDNRKRADAREAAGPVDKPHWSGDPEVRRSVASDKRYGEGFAASYIDPAKPGARGGIVAANRFAFEKLKSCTVLTSRGVVVHPPP